MGHVFGHETSSKSKVRGQGHQVMRRSIIITNEKIKVTRSRKRCRGTLQDYNKGEISKCQSKLWTNRNVFSWCLNGTREETVRRDGGRLFHARGAATGKARSPKVDLCTGLDWIGLGPTTAILCFFHLYILYINNCRPLTL